MSIPTRDESNQIPDIAFPDALVMTSDAEMLNDLKAVLEEVGLSTKTASASDQILMHVSKQPFFMVFLDLSLPDGSGLALMQEIKYICPDLPVAILLNHDQITDAVECIRLGAADCLTRPLKVERLKDLILAHCDIKVHDTIHIGSPKKRINDYQIVCEIGRGSMGTVFLVNRDSKRYALKMFRPTGDAEEQHEMRKRFIREAELLKDIDHPHVVKIYDYDFTRTKEQPYIVMDLLSGVQLLDLEKRRQLGYLEKAYIIYQVADALSAIHDKGVTHRDVKPNNILVTDDLHTTLMDFGVAYTPGSDLTITNELLGSPAYMAPEAFDSSRVDARADIFSLGVLMYELFLGQLPFNGSSIADTASMICNDKPIEPRKIDPSFPYYLQVILGKMLRKPPNERYDNCEDLMIDLEPYLGDGKKASGSIWQHSIKEIGRALLGNDWK